ncbi:MAG: SDR family oxidoreductase [Candidatus Hodarchaeota archaeon]
MENIDKPMKDKICMVTGATSGIGKVTARALAQQGATVIVVGRNPEKAATTVSQIKQQTGNPLVELMLADLSSQQEVHQLVEQFKSRYQRLNVLVNNAGASFRKRQESIDGIEMTFALNHLGYFLLTNLLLDTLKSSAPARIVNVSSGEHKRVKLNFEDLQGKQKYSSYQAYKQSKLCNILFTYELAQRLEGTNVTINAVTPGLAKTKLGLENGGYPALMKRLINFFAGKSPEEGAQAIIYLATSPDVEGVTGKYFVKQEAVPSSDDSYDKDAARRLWQVSAELTELPVEDVP